MHDLDTTTLPETLAEQATADTPDSPSAIPAGVQKERYRAALETVEQCRVALTPYEEAFDKTLTELRTQFQEQHQSLYSLLNGAMETADLYEASLRQLALDHFATTGEKTLDDNLSIRVTKKLVYAMEKAVEWAASNAPFMVVRSVDKKKFDSTVADMGLDFVTVEESAVAVLKGLR